MQPVGFRKRFWPKDRTLGPVPVDASFIMVPKVFYCDSPVAFITALIPENMHLCANSFVRLFDSLYSLFRAFSNPFLKF